MILVDPFYFWNKALKNHNKFNHKLFNLRFIRRVIPGSSTHLRLKFKVHSAAIWILRNKYEQFIIIPSKIIILKDISICLSVLIIARPLKEEEKDRPMLKSVSNIDSYWNSTIYKHFCLYIYLKGLIIFLLHYNLTSFFLNNSLLFGKLDRFAFYWYVSLQSYVSFISFLISILFLLGTNLFILWVQGNSIHIAK